MKHNRRTKVIVIVALLVAVLGLSVGLSVYSKTLNIQKVQATVQGNSSNFDVVFSTSSTSASSGAVETGSVAGSTSGGTATINGTTISNLTATFNGGGFATYKFYVYNKGSIPAYLTGITYGTKTCTGAQGTNGELVQAACQGIKAVITVGDKTYGDSNGGNKTITDAPKLESGKSSPVSITIEVASTVVDGDFTATIPSITLTYSSQQNPT